MFKPSKQGVQKTIFDRDHAFPDNVMDMLKKSWADDFYRLVFTQINEARFSVLYSSKASRPNKAVNVLVGLLILKQQNQLSDDELIGSLYFDYRFQYALGLESELDKGLLCVNTLSNFRCRLVEHELQTDENLLQQEMESLTNKMAEFLSLNKSLARMDSTMIDSSCKKMTRIELVYAVIRNMVRELAKVEGLEYPENFAAFLKKGHQNETIYKTRSSEEGSKLQHLLQQAYDCFQWVQNASVCLDTVAFEHLSRLLQEQCVVTEDGVTVPIDGKKIAPNSLQNPSDPDATFRHKNGRHHIGSSLNIVEVHDPDKGVGLIMHADVKENTYSDAKFGEDFVKNHPLAGDIESLSVDGAYFHQETVKAANEKELEVNFSQMTGRPAPDGQMGVHQFEIDPNTHVVTKCPAGHMPFYTTYDADKERYTAKFDKRHCDNCPLSAHCQVKEQKKAYHLSFTANKLRTDEVRAKHGSEKHTQLSNFRAGIEGVPSVLKRIYGLNHLPIRGRVRKKIWTFTAVIAQNFNRCWKYLKRVAPATVGRAVCQ